MLFDWFDWFDWFDLMLKIWLLIEYFGLMLFALVPKEGYIH